MFNRVCAILYYTYIGTIHGCDYGDLYILTAYITLENVSDLSHSLP